MYLRIVFHCHMQISTSVTVRMAALRYVTTFRAPLNVCVTKVTGSPMQRTAKVSKINTAIMVG